MGQQECKYRYQDRLIMKPTLFVLAAGMGSRYGGLKQLDGLGPHGETIMDYSIYDAIQAGFGKVVFVIRRVFEPDFREKIVSKYENRIPVELVFQDLDNLPAGFSVPEGREKPWGTNHAVLMGKDVIHEPFAVINALIAVFIIKNDTAAAKAATSFSFFAMPIATPIAKSRARLPNTTLPV